MAKKAPKKKPGNAYITLNAELDAAEWKRIKLKLKPATTAQKWVGKVVMEAGSKL
jgi:hypothetical protein